MKNIAFLATFRYALRYLLAQPLSAALNLLLLTLALASITLVLLVSDQLNRAFERDVAGIDVVVGAKGSPLQLILAGVFHLDVPAGNVRLSEVRALQKNPQVAKLIPLSLGDSYGGFRIVGTTPDYLTHYSAKFAQGHAWAEPLQVVLGAAVASAGGLRLGDRFSGSHGLGGQGANHAAHPYLVSGVLAPCGCVLDRLILTATESVWQVHEAAHGPHDPAHGQHDTHGAMEENDRREVTLALIQYRSPLAAVTFPRFVNTTTGMQAAAPALEITRLLRIVGVGTDVLRSFGVVLLLTATLSVFIALWSAVRERRADLAMLRMLGASPAKVASLLCCEALWLALAASVLGLALGHGLTEVIGHWLAAERSLPLSGRVWLMQEAWVPVMANGVAMVAALVPAISAYRVDAGALLNER